MGRQMLECSTKKETGEDGGRYRTETQCLKMLQDDLMDKFKNSMVFGPLNKTSHVSEV